MANQLPLPAPPSGRTPLAVDVEHERRLTAERKTPAVVAAPVPIARLPASGLDCGA